MPKFVPIGQTVVDGDFLIFQDGCRHLVFSKFENLTVGTVKRAQLHSLSISNFIEIGQTAPRYGDFTIFKMALAAILDF